MGIGRQFGSIVQAQQPQPMGGKGGMPRPPTQPGGEQDYGFSPMPVQQTPQPMGGKGIHRLISQIVGRQQPQMPQYQPSQVQQSQSTPSSSFYENLPQPPQSIGGKGGGFGFNPYAMQQMNPYVNPNMFGGFGGYGSGLGSLMQARQFGGYGGYNLPPSYISPYMNPYMMYKKGGEVK